MQADGRHMGTYLGTDNHFPSLPLVLSFLSNWFGGKMGNFYTSTGDWISIHDIYN
ncbi:hypothetical protein NCCP2331_26410 [Sporosarcina sp. NCCP-2331]|nr:hypothetical protein NCCP2331_26410 [Sporosarcina sp. NCCP-2331]GLB56765.1 hypothetical protein NCCP2378_25520 [Sporosarcina sp. NCCP-2378]